MILSSLQKKENKKDQGLGAFLNDRRRNHRGKSLRGLHALSHCPDECAAGGVETATTVFQERTVADGGIVDAVGVVQERLEAEGCIGKAVGVGV